MIFGLAMLFVFIYVGSFLTYYWDKNTFYDFFQRFETLRNDGIVKIDDDKFEEYFNIFDKKMNSYSPIIIVASLVLSIGIGYIHYLYFEPYLTLISNFFWN